ncbi:MAG: hypothetical protein M1825_005540 [Sarcosagium campestre]|nr:MAG: hypothetical protein M1825_005540 [Sarcosagium campestre]
MDIVSPNVEPPPLLFGPRVPSPHPSHPDMATQLPPHIPQSASSLRASSESIQPSNPDQESHLPSSVRSIEAESHSEDLVSSSGHTPPSINGTSRPEDAAQPIRLSQDTDVTDPDAGGDRASRQLDMRSGIPNAEGSVTVQSSTTNEASSTPESAAAGSEEQVQPRVVASGPITMTESEERLLQDMFGLPAPPSGPTARHAPVSATGEEYAYSDTSTDSDDDRPLPTDFEEDKSVPDSEELKEIESVPEISATDGEHFESRFFKGLDDPEYVPGESGQLSWTIHRVRGTWEKPARELVMLSPKVMIGGLNWQIKFYPKGNATDHLSVYLEASQPDSVSKVTEPDSSREKTLSKPGEGVEFIGTQDKSRELISHVDEFPLAESGLSIISLGGDDTGVSLTKEERTQRWRGRAMHSSRRRTDGDAWSVAAQFGVVMYNPEEPRVFVSHGNKHRFCAESVDWGWTRFCGPDEGFKKRRRGQRRALLQNDTLAFTAYIRIIEDRTSCLWDACSRSKPWDSLQKTGIRSFSAGASRISSCAVAAITSFLLLAPVRRLIDSFSKDRAVAFAEGRVLRSKDLLPALARVLEQVRRPMPSQTRRRHPSPGTVSVAPILRSLEAQGISLEPPIDVVELWQILRGRIEFECRGTPREGIITDMFDFQLGRTTSFGDKVATSSVPRNDAQSSFIKTEGLLRLPICNRSVQQTLNELQEGAEIGQCTNPPKILQIELDRALWDDAGRTWKKDAGKVDIDETLDISKWCHDPNLAAKYTLYGLIVHSGDIVNGTYRSIVRPGGPASNWICFDDNDEGESRVRRLTRKQAVETHEGSPFGGSKADKDALAYVCIYVRNDVISEYLDGLPHLEENVKRDTALAAEKAKSGGSKDLRLRIFKTSIFENHLGQGILDSRYRQGAQGVPEALETDKSVIDLTVPSTATFDVVRKELASRLDSVKDPRQCLLWFHHFGRDTLSRPGKLVTGTFSIEHANTLCDSHLWLYVIPEADVNSILPTPPQIIKLLPEEPNTAPSAQGEGGPDRSPDAVPAGDQTPPESSTGPDLRVSDSSRDGSNVSDLIGRGETAHDAVNQAQVDSEGPSVERSDRSSSDSMIDTGVAANASNPDADHGVISEQGNASLVTSSEPAIRPTNTINLVNIGSDGTSHQVNASASSYAQIELLDAPGGVNRSVFVDVSQLPSAGRHSIILLRDHVGAGGEINAIVIPEHLPPNVAEDRILIFVKQFNVQSQQLVGKACILAKRDEPIGPTVLGVLGLSTEAEIELWEEKGLGRLDPIDKDLVPSRCNIGNCMIIAVQETMTPDASSAVFEEGGFTNPLDYAKYLSRQNTDPQSLDGPFVRDYFSTGLLRCTMKNGRPHGEGEQITPSGERYRGNFTSALRHGKGTLTSSDGDLYTGDFAHNELHGQGRLVYAATGNVYEGGFRHGKRHGKGVMHYEIADDEMAMCRICYENEIDALFYDCGHVCACITCARQVDQCPICRKTGVVVVKMFKTC